MAASSVVSGVRPSKIGARASSPNLSAGWATAPVVILSPMNAELGSSPKTRFGAKLRAMITTDILPGIVQAEHDWWFPERRGEEPELFGLWESNINVCTSDEPEHCDKMIGSWYYRAMLCKVYKA